MTRRNKKTGCGSLNFLFFIAILGAGYVWVNRNNTFNLTQFFPNSWETPIETIPIFTPPPSPNIPSVSTFPFPETVPQGTVINVGGSTSMVQITKLVGEPKATPSMLAHLKSN